MKKLNPGIDYIAISTPFYCFDESGRLLLHKRSKKCRDEHETWDTGSGQLNFGEEPEESVLREVNEEYNCKGIILEQLFPISVLRRQNGKTTHWLAIPFIIYVKHNTVSIGEPEKIDELGWFDLNYLPAPLHSAFETHILKTKRRKILEKYAGRKLVVS